MGGYISRPVSTYLSGMLKKLSLLLAFMGTPQFILLDEPLITIDAAALTVLYQWIADHHKQYGTSFLLSSHQILDVEVLPAQVLHIENQTLKAPVAL